MIDLTEHPRHSSNSINRAPPLPNSSHHFTLLSSLLLLDQLISHILAGAAPI
jgi:hypothetical protein